MLTNSVTNYRYGVSRVYNQQCGYTLTDVQTMHDRMKAVFKVTDGKGLDPAAGRARYCNFPFSSFYIDFLKP